MSRILRWLLLCCVVFTPLFAGATTSASVARTQVALGESVELLIATDQIRPPDYSALQGQFRVRLAGTERDLRYSNGQIAVDLRYQLLLEPLRVGLQTIPSIPVGGDRTQPLQINVLPAGTAPTAPASAPGAGIGGGPAAPQAPASGRGDVFLHTTIDDTSPYVQQAVGVVLRLYSAAPILDGQLDLDAPTGASMRKVGDDSETSELIGGRSYRVVERRFVLVPERSGPMLLPAARFRGHGQGGFVDDVFGDGRRTLEATGQPTTLQVQTIPASAAQPWLPLHAVQFEVLGAPTVATAGASATLTLQLRVDGASASQLPELMLEGGDGAQVFPEQPQVQEDTLNGRPRVIVTRRFAVVPAREGALQLRPVPLDWWNVERDQAERTAPPPITLQVGPGTGVAQATDVAMADVAEARPWYRRPRVMLSLTALAALAWLGALWWSRRKPKRTREDAEARIAAVATVDDITDDVTAAKSPAVQPPVTVLPTLDQALAGDDLAAITSALLRTSRTSDVSIESLREELADPEQVAAIDLLQRSRWGSETSATREALTALRSAFRTGPCWKTDRARTVDPLLPPLYPEP